MYPYRRLLPLLLAVAAGCATPLRVVAPADAAEVPIPSMVADLATADVVVFGEQHDSQAVHALHWRLLRDLHAARPDLIVSMEMFERDVQPVLWQYLLGDIDENDFLAKARPWSNYAGDYRPVIEFARANRLEVLAANAPRSAATLVARQGLQALSPSPDVARTTSAPEDDYAAAFASEMRRHPGDFDDAKARRYYEAQCLKDDTMAESIADRLALAHRDGRRPLVVHFCGHLHSDHRRGTVERLQQRLPDLRIKVLGVENVPAGGDGTIAAAPGLADYVVLLPADANLLGAEPAEVAEPKAAAAAPVAAARDEQGGRPGLGFRPDYEVQIAGCAVADLVPGGAAEAAGIAVGDVIVAFAGQPVESVADYAAALGTVAVGDTVKVAVRRGSETLELPVVVGVSRR